MTKDEFKWLSDVVEPRLTTAYHSQYARGMARSDSEKLRDIYERNTGSKLNVNFNCSSCILGLLQKVYPLYEAYKKKIEKQQEKDSNESGGEDPRKDLCDNQQG